MDTVGDDGEVVWRADEDLAAGDDALAPALQPWKVLIVDDDVDVHVVTKFALSNAHFQGRRISFLHAYSGAEAIAVLRGTPDIALVLLDVIMETQEAGLRVSRQIREELDNHLVRIVLRTGQPGQSLEHSIIIDYDINDFWCKTDLTTRKLFTTVIASLRAYAGLCEAEQRIAQLQVALTQARQFRAALAHHTLTLALDRQGMITDASEELCSLLECGREELLGEKLSMKAPGAPALLEHEATWAGDLSLAAGAGIPHLLRTVIVPLDGAEGDNSHIALMSPAGSWIVHRSGDYCMDIQH
jgi:CheY-like chemotaxis protein